MATSGQTEGARVLQNKLIAVITKLDESHEQFQGKWFAEAFLQPLENMAHETFDSLDHVAQWIVTNEQ